MTIEHYQWALVFTAGFSSISAGIFVAMLIEKREEKKAIKRAFRPMATMVED